MFTITCPGCKRENVALKDCYREGDRLVCAECFERQHPTEEERNIPGVARLGSMDTCAFCGKRAPEVVVKNMSDSPVCVGCSQELISRPFPLWVKAFFAGVLVLVVVSIAWNWRYFQAHSALADMEASVEAGDVDAVIGHMKNFQAFLPEEHSLDLALNYWRGIQAMQHDSATAAIDLFEKVERFAPGQYQLEPMLTQARLGSAFDGADYDGFLFHSKRLLEMDRTAASSFASLSSAFACKYATTSDEAYRDSAMQMLDKARSFGADTSFTEYEQRILFRLHTKEILALGLL